MSHEGHLLFEYRYGQTVVDLHLLIKDMCVGTNLYKVPQSSYELMEFVKIFSSITDDVFDEADDENLDSSDEEIEVEVALPGFS